MAEICVESVNGGSTESSTAAAVLSERSSRAARRRRIEIRRRRLVADAGMMAPASATSPGRKRPAGDADSSSDSTSITRSRSNTPPPPPKAAAVAAADPAYGVTSIIGRRRDMEDAVAIHPDFLRGGGGCHFFGVFDGHGCSHIAASCKKWMHETVAEEMGSGAPPKAEQVELWKKVMERSFARVDADVIGIPSCSAGTASCRCELQTPKCEHVGSTAVVAVVGPEVIVVANAGDSRAVLCRNGVAVPLSEDHKPDRPDELQRIEDAGGRVIYWDGARVLGVLAMSRAIGDGYLKPFVTAEPEVTVTKREVGDECLILASDGLWDVVTNEMACYIVKMCLRGCQAATDDMAGSKKACSDAAVLLTKLAMARGSTDNISVVVVDMSNSNEQHNYSDYEDHYSQEIRMEEIINDGVERSNVVYDLSEADDFRSCHELDSDETDGDDDADDSDSTSTDNDERDDIYISDANDTEGHIPTAPWFATEEITNNNVNDNSGDFSNVNPLSDDLFEGQCFPDKQTAIDAIKVSHIRESINYRVLKSTTVLYEAKCVVAECPWRIRVIQRKRYGYFQITKLPAEHNCLLRTIQRDHKNLSSRWIANTIKQQVMESPYLKVGNIMSQITEIYKYHVSYKKAWLGKQKAISDVYGDWATSYSKLPMFLSALMHFNPGTSASIEAEVDVTKPNTSVCKRVWWAFKAMADGWQYARPVISIDGTFLKGKYNGKLLIAMGSDSNNHQYPLAYGLVNEETTANWSWFLRRLRRYICRTRRGVCIISDRHAEIIEAMKKEQNGFTGDMGIHRFCLLHVRSNFSSAYPGLHLKMLCWSAGNTSQVRKFDVAMKKIKELNPDAEEWLRNIPLEMWTMSHDGGYRYGQATKMVESFNGNLRSARFLPITSMVEYIYYRSVKLVADRRTQTLDDLQSGHTYCKKSRELFENIERKASTHKIIPYNEQRGVFEVITARYKTKKGSWKGGNKHTIDLHQGFCSCGKWHRYHSPCSHIVAGCLTCNLDWKQYIEPYHNLTTLYEMWQYEFHPIPNQAYWTFPIANDWERYGILIPDENLRKKKNKRGQRGQSQRIRTEMDNSRRAIICGRCGQEGHTRRSLRCPQQGHQ